MRGRAARRGLLDLAARGGSPAANCIRIPRLELAELFVRCAVRADGALRVVDRVWIVDLERLQLVLGGGLAAGVPEGEIDAMRIPGLQCGDFGFGRRGVHG